MPGDVYFPDIGNALASGASAGLAGIQRNYLAEDHKAKQSAAPFIQAALAGDKTALNEVATRHPDTAMKLAPLLERMDAGQRTKYKETAEFTARASNAILQADPAERPAVYAQLLADGTARGFDLSKLPPQYTPDLEPKLRSWRMMSDQFLKEDGGVTYAPPAGGGATPAGAIGGIESGGKYDAVGPVANAQGHRAYGKYQVLEPNVGPWTQEVLGKAMTPQEFLANPQAQDAVFKAKFGQYQQKYGPEGAARAWFAGEGGMNNPNAKDVLGTTVQGYGQKFTQATGGAPTAPPGVAQGDGGPSASPAGNGPPAALAPLRGLQLPPGARVALQKGVPIVKDGAVLFINPDNTWGAAPLPQRAEPKDQQPPAGYRFAPDGGLAPIPGGPADPTVQRRERVPPGYRMTPDGGLEHIPGGPADPTVAKKASPMTEGQANAALYADRMRAAEKIIAENEKAGLSPTGKALEYVPGGNYMQSEGYQLYEQARRDFINAVLRRESGAVISEQEFANAEKQYFPRPGDKPEVLKQKADNRRVALEGISRAAGSSYKPQESTPAAAAPPAAQPQGAPKPGTVEQGYRFKGGNPADQGSWERVQ